MASRLLTQAREIFSESCPHRFHDRKIKRLYLYVTRYMPSKSESRQRKVKAAFRTLIERTGWIVAIAGEFCVQAASRENSALVAIALELKAYLPSMKKIVTTARRAQIEGETVPASDRVFSLFEQHTELISVGDGKSRWSSVTRCSCVRRWKSSSPTTRSTRSNLPIAT